MISVIQNVSLQTETYMCVCTRLPSNAGIMAKQTISHECALLILEKKRFFFSLITHLYDL